MRVIIKLDADDMEVAQEIAEFVESSLEETELGDYVTGVFWANDPLEAFDRIVVYNDPERHLLHLAGPNPGTPFTACGLDAALFDLRREAGPLSRAGIWCAECLKKQVPE